MNTLKTRARSNGHDSTHAGMNAEATCPVCGRTTADRTILARIRSAEETRKAAEQARIEEAGKALTARFTRERVAAEAQARAAIAKAQAATKDAVEKAKKDTSRAAEKRITELRAAQQQIVDQQVASVRETLAKQLDETLAAERAGFFEEKQKLEAAVADLQRRLQRKHPVDMGGPLETAIHTALATGMREDECTIVPIKRGRAGPDLLVECIAAGEVIDRIAIECKNARWSSAFISKAITDGRDHSAAFCVIVTTAMPKETRGLTVIDGIIVCEVDIVVPLVRLLREQVVALHRQRLTTEERDQRSTALLDFVASKRCSDLLREFVQVSKRLRALDEREISSHRLVWKKRAELLKAFDETYRTFMTTVTGIMNGTADTVVEEVLA